MLFCTSAGSPRTLYIHYTHTPSKFACFSFSFFSVVCSTSLQVWIEQTFWCRAHHVNSTSMPPSSNTVAESTAASHDANTNIYSCSFEYNTLHTATQTSPAPHVCARTQRFTKTLQTALLFGVAALHNTVLTILLRNLLLLSF